MARIVAHHAPPLVTEFRNAAERIRGEIESKAWSPRLGAFAATYGGDTPDAALLEMANLRFLPHSDARLHNTIDAIRSNLSQDGWLLRYREDDGLGNPTVAFLLCSYWLVEALATVGRHDEAKDAINHVLSVCSPLGLLSEDCETASLRMLGNFPQAYSHVGLIHAAFSASPRWDEML